MIPRHKKIRAVTPISNSIRDLSITYTQKGGVNSSNANLMTPISVSELTGKTIGDSEPLIDPAKEVALYKALVEEKKKQKENKSNKKKNTSERTVFDKTEIKPEVEVDNAVIADVIRDSLAFDKPQDIQEWFRDGNNYFKYLYGLGKILRTKQKLLEKLSTSLGAQIAKTNANYDMGIQQISSVLPSLPLTNPDFDKKEKMVDEVTDDINKSFKDQFYVLLQKKIRYDEAIEKLKNRRAYMVYYMNSSDNGFEQIVMKNIMPMASDIYESYRGIRYLEIRKMIFSYILICANYPELIENSFVLNTSITGPAGSGKTTLAKKLAKWFNVVGFITSDTYMDNPDASYREVGAPELIAPYVGQTAPKTSGVLYSSLEQALFIDEAYSVAGCTFDNQGNLQGSPYGDDFIAVLLPFITTHPAIGSILVAGYKNLMEICFFKRNEGLPRRFPTKIDLPLYTTDELYDMFLNGGIVRRQISAYADKQIRSLFQKNRQIIYLGIKPSFLMFHFDTSYTSFDIIRKYLLYYRNRGYNFEQAGQTISLPTHSYTITNHVLTCLLTNPIRRNILRRYFYKEVMKFDTQNLSYFPAQAGEMALVADMVNRKIEVEFNSQQADARIQVEGGAGGDEIQKIRKRLDQIDSEIETTQKQIAPLQEQLDKLHMSIIGGIEEQNLNLKLKLVRTTLQRLLKESENKEEELKFQIIKETLPTFITYEQEMDVFNSYFENKGVAVKYFQSALPVPSTSPEIKPSSTLTMFVEVIRRGYEDELSQFQNNINNVFIKPIFGDFLPSLEEVRSKLFKEPELLDKMIDLYVSIATKEIDELEAIAEKDFPVNMIKNDVLNEKLLIEFYKTNKKDSGLYQSEKEQYDEFRRRFLGREDDDPNLDDIDWSKLNISDVPLEHWMMIKYAKMNNVETTPEYIKDKAIADWEDFAMKE